MNDGLLIAGGGIGGLACALAMSRSGRAVTVLEQASDFTEVGAGIQLGPNAMRVLADWGCARALKAVATYPDNLRVRDAHDGRELGHLRLGSTALSRYGHPHACIHRADLHRLLLEAVQLQTPATLRLRARVEAFDVQADAVRVALDEGRSLFGAALIGCSMPPRRGPAATSPTVGLSQPSGLRAGCAATRCRSGSARACTSSATPCAAASGSTWLPWFMAAWVKVKAVTKRSAGHRTLV
jgi:hypothetical protein